MKFLSIVLFSIISTSAFAHGTHLVPVSGHVHSLTESAMPVAGLALLILAIIVARVKKF